MHAMYAKLLQLHTKACEVHHAYAMREVERALHYQNWGRTMEMYRHAENANRLLCYVVHIR